MLRFNDFLLEYLTPEQEKRYSKVGMDPKARADTDHFFGAGNDHVREELKGYNHDKSEVHKEVERHLGRELSHDEYKQGKTKDKYGRDVKLSKMITDPQIQHKFSQDNTRASKNQNHYMTVVRGTHVAGQTNPEPDEHHPKGHNWAQQSCKNIEDGCNKHYIPDEIHHGTVVVRAHDNNHQEIYRATLQPHHPIDDPHGKPAYALNSEYGVKHPAFTAHAHDVAKRLSGTANIETPQYRINDHVYNDKGQDRILHPSLTSPDLSKLQDHKELSVRKGVAEHPNATTAHLSKALDDPMQGVARAAASNPNATEAHLSKALDNPALRVRSAAVQNPNATHQILNKAIKDKHADIRATVAEHPKATTEHITKLIKDNDDWVRYNAVKHSNANAHHITRALNDKSSMVRVAAIENPNATPAHISKALTDHNEIVRTKAMMHPNVQPEHIHKALDDESMYVQHAAAKHPNASPANLHKALNHVNKSVAEKALENRNIQPEHLDAAMKHESPYMRATALDHPKVQLHHIEAGLKDKMYGVRQAAEMAKEKFNQNHSSQS